MRKYGFVVLSLLFIGVSFGTVKSYADTIVIDSNTIVETEENEVGTLGDIQISDPIDNFLRHFASIQHSETRYFTANQTIPTSYWRTAWRGQDQYKGYIYLTGTSIGGGQRIGYYSGTLYPYL